MHRSRAVGGPGHVEVVQDHGDAIGRETDVELDHVGPRKSCGKERSQRVFGMRCRRAAMRDDCGPELSVNLR